MFISENVVLRNVTDADLELLLELRNNVPMQEMLTARPRPNDKQKLLHWIRSRIDDDTKELFIVAKKKENNAIGFIQLNNIDFINGHCELGICFHQKFQGKGYFRNSLNLIEYYISNILNLHKIVVNIRQDNGNSMTAFKKQGFRQVGILKKHLIYGKIKIDVVLMEKELK